ncbi:MAG: carbonic anhydrase [Anaerolineaceae bacterium]|nr:carbonic anhydrase [Anaerolineaceae bacterium]MAU11718.1 carbonic anhydrase [Anaerolineaceae bacterium]
METQTATTQANLTPAEALIRLQEGNARFVTNRQANRDLMQQVETTSEGQYPFAVVLGCVDSRVSPELLFDQGVGDIFSARIAGNFVNEDILGSMEFACKVAGSKLILVLGHSKCGAIMGACDDVELGNLTGLLSKLKPAVEAISLSDGEERTSRNSAFVQQVAEKNVALTIEAIKQQSPVLNEMLEKGEIEIAGAMYDVDTGIVTF